MSSLFAEAAAFLEAQVSFAFVTVFEQEGSTPRGPGAKMLVLADRILETIGGGSVEGQVIADARAALQAGDNTPRILRFDMSREQSGGEHACGGSTKVLLDFPQRDAATYQAAYEAAAAALQSGRGGAMVTSLTDGVCFYTADADTSLPSAVLDAVSDNTATCVVTQEGATFVCDLLPVQVRVHLFGGGHVSHAVAKLMPDLAFSTVVYDDRAEYLTAERFPHAQPVLVADFTQLPDATFDARDYMLIITRGHQYDKEVLAWALSHATGYIGMIGSRDKCRTVFEALRAEGFSDEDIARVHAPIGLPIGGDTPAEIAISIAAQLVAWRWTHHSHHA